MAGQVLVAELVQAALVGGGERRVEVLQAGDPGLVERLAELAPEVTLAFLDANRLAERNLVSLLVHRAVATPVIAVVPYETPQLLADLLAAGGAGYLTYQASLAEIEDACSAAMRGEVITPGGHREGAPLPMQYGEALRGADLTPRETEILRRLVAGESTGQISGELRISVHTARTHVQRILQKLGVHSKLEAAAYAAKNHLV